MRWRIGISSKTARRQSGCRQMFHMRQRWGAAVWRAQTQVLLGRLKCALLGWEEAESRRAAEATPAEASWRSHASGTGNGGGLDGGGWGAGYGGDVGRVGRQWSGWESHWRAGREAHTPRLVGACERQVRVFLGASCAAVKPQKENQNEMALYTTPHNKMQ
jgi:hypothetical protein